MMPFEAFHSEYAHGRMYWLVVHIKKPAAPIEPGSTMLRRVQLSTTNDIIVDLHSLGMNVALAGGKVIRVSVQSLSFDLDCTDGVKLVEDLAMRFQLQGGG